MKRFDLKEGLDVPISGAPKQVIEDARKVNTVALTGDDYIGMKPTMEVAEGDRVKTGQLLFLDKKTEGLRYTSPATGTVTAINRGAKRKFETVIIEIEKDEFISFFDPQEKGSDSLDSEQIRSILQEAGMWCCFRTRPFGKVPKIAASPASLFVTAMDTRPLAADPAIVINEYTEEFARGMDILESLIDAPIHLCIADGADIGYTPSDKIDMVAFAGPHPAGLPSTHIHMLDQATEARVIWHIEYHDVIGIGHLFNTGQLPTEKIIALSGPAMKEPRLLRTRIGACIDDICKGELIDTPLRLLSGSVLDGRMVDEFHRFLGRYHHQIAALHEGSGRGLFNWAHPGGDRYSLTRAFSSALNRSREFAMNTALWGGERAIYPIDSYTKVMPLDFIILPLLKSIAVCDTEKCRTLGALELIEDDLALCSFVCPGKNDFGPMLRKVLTEIELEG